MANPEIWGEVKEWASMESERKPPPLDSPNTQALDYVKPDPVNAPPHYTRLSPQPIDVIEAWGLGFHAAQVVKYLSRAGFKDPKKLIEDLEKAAFYLNRWIERLKRDLQ